jgi:hypothetical protein
MSYCVGCGKEIVGDNVAFCPSCGARRVDRAADPAGSPVTASAPPPSYDPAPAPAPVPSYAPAPAPAPVYAPPPYRQPPAWKSAATRPVSAVGLTFGRSMLLGFCCIPLLMASLLCLVFVGGGFSAAPLVGAICLLLGVAGGWYIGRTAAATFTVGVSLLVEAIMFLLLGLGHMSEWALYIVASLFGGLGLSAVFTHAAAVAGGAELALRAVRNTALMAVVGGVVFMVLCANVLSSHFAAPWYVWCGLAFAGLVGMLLTAVAGQQHSYYPQAPPQ